MADLGQPECSTHFVRTNVVAEAAHAARIRQEFSNWLVTHFAVDRVKSSDIVLAVNEALANAAESAYADAPEPGVMHLYADYDADTATLTVTVADEGTWRPAKPRMAESAHGRGIPLMEALADQAVIEPSETGTRAYLKWDDVVALADAEVHDRGSRTT